MIVSSWHSNKFLPILLLITLQAISAAAVIARGSMYFTSVQLVDKGLISPAVQYVQQNNTRPITPVECASVCSSNAHCGGFSIKNKNGSAEGAACSTSNSSSGVADAPVTGDGFRTRLFLKRGTLGADGSFAPIKANDPCLLSTQCPAGTSCSQGYCQCPAGFLALNGNGVCVAEPAADASGYRVMSDGYRYKRLSVLPTSLANARSACYAESATLPVPYGIPGVGVKALEALRTFMRPGEEIYVGIVRSGSYTLRTFVTDGGAINFTAAAGNSSQFWATGEPNANSDAEADAVTMTLLDGWMDKPSTNAVNTLICCKSSYTYQLATGKYYRLFQNLWPKQTQAEGMQRCQNDGGRLAITRGPSGRAILQIYWALSGGLETFFLDGKLTGVNTWTFSDGVQQNSLTNRENWASSSHPVSGDDCIVIWQAMWGSGPCWHIKTMVLCERSYF